MKFVLIHALFLVLLMAGCGKRKTNAKLAKTYYKMALLELGNSFPENQKYKKALQHIDMALVQNEKEEYLSFKAVLLFKLNEIEKCKEVFEKLLCGDLNPVFRAEVQNNYACLLAQCGQVEKAVNIWQQLEASCDYLTPEVALINQGKYYLAKGELKKAKEKLMSAVQIAPNYVDAQYYLAIAAKELSDLQLCKNQINTVLFLETQHFGAKRLLDDEDLTVPATTFSP